MARNAAGELHGKMWEAVRGLRAILIPWTVFGGVVGGNKGQQNNEALHAALGPPAW